MPGDEEENQMGSTSLEQGLYVNIFPVTFPDKQVHVMIAESKNLPSLRELRAELQQSQQAVRVYQYRNKIFGYGRDMEQLASKGFQRQEVSLLEHPKWCVRLINEGLTEHLKSKGYREWPGKGRITLYEPHPYRTAAQGKLKVFRGYDLRTIYLWREHFPIFGLIVDIRWEIQDESGQRLNTHEIARYDALVEIAVIQDEYLLGNRINLEVSRLRLHKHILPFIDACKEFVLPLRENIKASVEETPLRVILGVSL